MKSRAARPPKARGSTPGDDASGGRGPFSMRFEVDGDEYAILSMPLSDASAFSDQLTAAEREVLELVLQGRSNLQIATVRGTSARTVANQLAAIYKKLGVTSRSELAARIATGRRNRVAARTLEKQR